MSRPLVSRNAAIEHMRRGDEQWAAAVRAFNSYPVRLRNLADVAKEQSKILTLASLAEVEWNPRPGASNLTLAYELEAASGRPGPPNLWARFDKSVGQLGLALEGNSMEALADAFAALASAAGELAEACEADAGLQGRQAG